MSQYDWRLPDPDTQAEFYTGVTMKRFLAFVVDSLLIAVLTVLIIPFTAFTGIFFFPALMFVVGFAYRVIFLAGGSATLGMHLFAIEFRKDDGAKFDLGTAFLHTMGFTVSWMIPLAQVASIVLMFTSTRGQGLTDHILGTVALHKSARN